MRFKTRKIHPDPEPSHCSGCQWVGKRSICDVCPHNLERSGYQTRMRYKGTAEPAKTPKRVVGAKCPTEDIEQGRVVDWLRACKILFHSSPNGGKRHIVTAVRLKRLGCSAGFPDLIVLDPPPAMPGIHAVALEMKRQRGGVISDHQRDWLLALSERGWYTVICAGGDEAIRVLERLGYGGKGKGGH